MFNRSVKIAIPVGMGFGWYLFERDRVQNQFIFPSQYVRTNLPFYRAPFAPRLFPVKGTEDGAEIRMAVNDVIASHARALAFNRVDARIIEYVPDTDLELWHLGERLDHPDRVAEMIETAKDQFSKYGIDCHLELTSNRGDWEMEISLWSRFNYLED
jgi:hypothetical protein